MCKNEKDASRMAEQLKKLPESVQERVGYIIQGATLAANNYVGCDEIVAALVSHQPTPPNVPTPPAAPTAAQTRV